MGLSLKKIFKSAVKSIPAAIGGFAQGGFAGAALGVATRKFLPTGGGGGIGAGVPSIQAMTGAAPLFRLADPVVQGEGAVMPAAGAVPMIVRGMTIAVARAIGRLGLALGIPVTLANLARVGSRLWRTVTVFARRHPGLSVVSFLVSLGLTIEEASEFLMWGQLKQRRRRGRGISARDIRNARRTIRKIAAFQRDLGGMRGGGRRAAAHHHHPRAGVV